MMFSRTSDLFSSHIFMVASRPSVTFWLTIFSKASERAAVILFTTISMIGVKNGITFVVMISTIRVSFIASMISSASMAFFASMTFSAYMAFSVSITFFGGIFGFVNEFQSQGNSASVVKQLKLGYETANDHVFIQ